MDIFKVSLDDDETIEMSNLNTIDCVLNSSNLRFIDSTKLEIFNSPSFEFALNFLLSSKFHEILKENPKVIEVHFKIQENFILLDEIQLNEIDEKFNDKTILLRFQSEVDGKFFIRWILKGKMKMVMIEIVDELEDLSTVAEFLTNFISRCLRNNETALHSEISIDEMCSFVKLQNLIDFHERTVLMNAAEEGNLPAVNYFIKTNMSVTYKINDEIAIDYAYNNKQYEIVLTLLKANSPFPRNFNVDFVSDELKIFVDLMTKMHQAIETNDIKGAMEIIEENPELRYFYNTENQSAMAHATRKVTVDIFELLLLKNLLYGPNEDYNEIVSSLNFEDGETLRQINFKNARNFTDKHIMMLMANSTISYGAKDKPQKLNYILKAFTLLNNIPKIQKILEISAAARNLQLVFDFENEILQFLDPTAGPYTDGSFYLNSGQIAIAAKKLLNSETEHFVLGALAHELCHFAMHLVYKNDAKPFAKDDKKSEQLFKEINIFCEQNKEQELIINWVYDYNKNVQLAELIVRVPHILGHYYDNTDRINEITSEFQSLFDYFECQTVPNIEKRIVELDEEYERKKQEKVLRQRRKISLLRKIILVLMILSPILVSLAIYIFYSPIYSFDGLENSEKIKLKKATVDFHGVKVSLENLFGNDSNVYDLLSSEQIKSGLSNDTRNLSQAIASTYSQFVFLNWTNMTEELRQNFVNRKVNFQSEIVTFNDLFEEFKNLEILPLKFLSVHQIRDTFNDIPINISSIVTIETKCFIDRLFKREILEGENFDTKDLEVPFDYSGVLNKLTTSKLFILSNQAGEGKTTVFRHFAIQLKKKFPNKWIQFADLKQYTSAFERGKKMDLFSSFGNERDYDSNNYKTFIDFMIEAFKFNSLEREIFKVFYKLGKIVFFWDGVDEVSPNYKDFILNLTDKIKKTSGNSQLISTRPQYSRDFRKMFNVDSYELLSLNEKERSDLMALEVYEKSGIVLNLCLNIKSEQNKFALNNLTLNNSSQKLIHESIIKGKEIMNSIERKESFRLITNPLIITMIAEIAVDPEVKTNQIFNFYSVFDIFIDKKLEIFLGKGEEAKKDIIKYLKSKFAVIETHQAYAIKLLYTDVLNYAVKVDLNISNFKVMKNMKKLTYDQITRIGIVHVNSEENFSFAHRTFAEFLVCKFLVENLEEFNVKSEMELTLFNSVMFSTDSNLEVVKNFFDDYLKSDNLTDDFKGFRHQYESLESVLKNTNLNNCWINNSTNKADSNEYFDIGQLVAEADLFDENSEETDANEKSKETKREKVFKTLTENAIKSKELSENIPQKCSIRDSTISKFFQFAYFSSYFQAHNIHLGKFLINEYFTWTYNDFEILTDHWEQFNEALGDDFKSSLTKKLHDDKTILFDVSKNLLSTGFRSLLKKLNQTLTASEMIELLFAHDSNNQTIFMAAALNYPFQYVEDLWNIIQTLFSESEVKAFLLLEDKNLETALQYAASSSESETFPFVSDLYLKLFNDSKIREILMKISDDNIPFVFSTIDNNNEDTIHNVCEFLSKLFENNPLELRNILVHHNKVNQTVFSKLKYQRQSSKVKSISNLLRNTFKRIENKKFDEYFRVLLDEPRTEFKFSSMIENFNFYIFVCCNESVSQFMMPSNVKYHIKDDKIWYSIDFEDLTTNWESIKSNLEKKTFKDLLLSKNKIDENLLHVLLTNESSLNYLESFLDKLLESFVINDLNEIELYNILSAEDSEYASSATPLMLAALNGAEKFEIFVKFLKVIESKLSHELFLNSTSTNFELDQESEPIPSQSISKIDLDKFKLKNFLLTENKFNMTALQFSSLNNNPQTFLHVKSLYDNILGENITKDIILKTDNYTLPFTYDLIESSRNETALEVANYMKNGFINDKQKLREFLSQRERYGYGESIYQYFKNKDQFQNNLNIFKELLRFTFDDDESYRKHLEDLEHESEL